MNGIFWILSALPLLAIGSPGCMDNSWHMKQPFDTKSYHVVSRNVGNSETYCPCPCKKLTFDRGICLECGHAHDVQPWVIIRYNKKEPCT